jgi:hypothetical protein
VPLLCPNLSLSDGNWVSSVMCLKEPMDFRAPRVERWSGLQ